MVMLDTVSSQLVLGLFVAVLCTAFAYCLPTGRSRFAFDVVLCGTVVLASLLSGAHWTAASLLVGRAFVAFTDLEPKPVPWRRMR